MNTVLGIAIGVLLSAASVSAQGAFGAIAPPAGIIADDGQGHTLSITNGRLIFETPNGVFWFGGNEFGCVSKGDDPCKLRLASPTGHNCISDNKSHPLNPFDQQELALLCGSATEDDDRAVPSGGGQWIFGVNRKWSGGDGAMRKKLIVSPAYTEDGEPVVRLYPALGPFAEGVPQIQPPMNAPPPPVANCGAIPPGDFVALSACYRFASGDQDYYLSGRMTWAQVIADMERRAR